jgi:hypothetical protein
MLKQHMQCAAASDDDMCDTRADPCHACVLCIHIQQLPCQQPEQLLTESVRQHIDMLMSAS